MFALPVKGMAQSHAPNAREVGRIWKTISVADSKLEAYAGFAEESVKFYVGAAMALASWVDL